MRSFIVSLYLALFAAPAALAADPTDDFIISCTVENSTNQEVYPNGAVVEHRVDEATNHVEVYIDNVLRWDGDANSFLTVAGFGATEEVTFQDVQEASSVETGMQAPAFG